MLLLKSYRFTDEHKYAFLLAGLLFLIGLYPLLGQKPFSLWLVKSINVLILLSIIHFIKNRSFSFWFACILAMIAIVVDFIEILYRDESLILFSHTNMFVFMMIAMMAMLEDITYRENITRDIVLGSLCVYILIALIFSNVYTHLEAFVPNSFAFAHHYENELEKIFDLSYFSFTTLSTVGFGDIVPKTMLAKSLVMVEEITGLFYLAILVSRLVSSMKV